MSGPYASLALRAALVIASLTPFAAAQWTTDVKNPPGEPPLSENILNINTGTTSTVALQLFNPRVSLADGLQNDETILPGNCVSTSPNRYGWNFWANKMLPLGAVGAPSGSRITLSLITLPGFSPTATETVTCGIGLTSTKTGRAYGQMSAADQYVQFTIIATTRNIVMRIVDPTTSTVFPVRPADNVASLTEGGIREFGINVDFLFVGDVFNATLVDMIMNTTKCSSTDTEACAFFMQLVMTNYFLDPVNDPHRIQIRVSRKLSRFFSAVRDIIFTLELPSGKPYGLKPFPTTLFQRTADVAFTIASYLGPQAVMCIVPFLKGTASPSIGRRATTIMVLSENCIRGRNWTRQCPYVFWVSINSSLKLTASSLVEFTRTPLCGVDLVETAFFSPTNGYLQPFVSGFYTTTSRTGLNTPLPAEANYDLWVNVSALPEYNIDVPETISFIVPFSCLLSKEPVNAISLVIVPSPGDLVGFVRNITINDIWNGGVEFQFHLGGERWLDIATVETAMHSNGTLFDKILKEFITMPGQEGWEKWKTCVLPEGSVSFLRNTSGLVSNQSILILKFQACPMYVNGADEIVTFLFPSSALTATGLPYANVTNMTFGIKFFNGTFAIEFLQRNYSIDDIGVIQFVVTLQGGELFTPDVATCVTAILAEWPSNKPVAELDKNGWSNPEVRQAILPASAVSYSTTSYGGLAIATFTFVRPESYATRAGETVNISAMPGACLASGNTIFPNQSYPIAIIPRRMTISMQLVNLSTPVPGSTGGAAYVLNGSTMRDGGFAVILSAFNDTFDSSDPRLGERINAGFVTTSVQPRGFAALNSTFLSNTTTAVNDTTVIIYFSQAISYVVSSPEFIRIAVDASWTASKQRPFGADDLNFTVIPSAGYITVDPDNGWFGSKRNVTDADVRNGKLFFTFRMLGDQWIQERNPYVNIFRSADNSSSGFISLVEQLVPTVKFFSFAIDGPYQLFTLQLQSSDQYDIFRDEVIYIVFSSATVSSRIAPVVTLENKIRNCNATLLLTIPGSFAFCIQAAAGRAVLSGMKDSLDEKVVRRGDAVLFATLFGESWRPANLSLCLRSGIRFSNAQTHALYERTALPLDGSTIRLVSPSTISITIVRATAYSLQGLGGDALRLFIPPACVLSGIAVWPATSTVPIAQTPGELSLFNITPSVVTEETLRTRSVSLNISIDGDAWNSEVRLHGGCNASDCGTHLCTSTSHLFSGACVSDFGLRNGGGGATLSCVGSATTLCLDIASFDRGAICNGSAACLNEPPCAAPNVGRHSMVCDVCNMLFDADRQAREYYKLDCRNTSLVTLAFNCDDKCTVCQNETVMEPRTCAAAPTFAPFGRGPHWMVEPLRPCQTYRGTRYASAMCSGGASAPVVVEEFYRATGVCEFHTLLQPNVTVVECPVDYYAPAFYSLLEGFSSTASPIAEPTGFAVQSQALFFNASGQGKPIVAIRDGFLTFVLSPSPTFDIKESEIVSITLLNPQLVRSGTVPNPFSVYFTVVAVPTTLIAYYQPVTGQFDRVALGLSIMAALSLSSPDGIILTQTGRLGNLFVIKAFFEVKPTELDFRTSLQLTDILMSFTPAFLQGQMQFVCLSLDDGSGQCTNNAVQRTNATSETKTVAEAAPTIFFAAGFLLIVLLVAADYVYQTFAQAKLPGGNRPVVLRRNKYNAESEGKDKVSLINVNLGETDRQVRPQSLRDFYTNRKKRAAAYRSNDPQNSLADARGGASRDAVADDPFDLTKQVAESQEKRVISISTIRHRRLDDPMQVAAEVRHNEAVETARELRGYRKANRLADDIMDTL